MLNEEKSDSEEKKDLLPPLNVKDLPVSYANHEFNRDSLRLHASNMTKLD